MDLLSKDIDKLTFEEAIERLNKVVDFIEEGNVSLDDSIKYYEGNVKYEFFKIFCRFNSILNLN